MRVGKIKQMIQKAVADEKRHGRLAGTVRDYARKHGGTLSKEQVDGVVGFVRSYVEHVPLYMEQGAEAARQIGMAAEMNQLLAELEAYWFAADDLVPDHLGLLGLMDDAYASLLLLQALSDYCQATHGRPLLSQNLTVANQGMRNLVGEPIVSILEQRVGLTLANSMMHRVVGQVAMSGFSFGSAPDPIWGNASASEIANVRLGAMGVV